MTATATPTTVPKGSGARATTSNGHAKVAPRTPVPENVLKLEGDAMKAKVLKVAVRLANEGLLGALEARLLQEMVWQESPILMAAFKVRERLSSTFKDRETEIVGWNKDGKCIIASWESWRGMASYAYSPI